MKIPYHPYEPATPPLSAPEFFGAKIRDATGAGDAKAIEFWTICLESWERQNGKKVTHE